MPATWSPATPRDWVAGELVTATHMNDEVRNRMMYLKASPAFDGNPTVAGTLAVTGAVTLSSTLAVTGASTLSSTLVVTGAGTFSSTLTVASNMGIAAAAKLYLDGVAMSGNTYLHEQSADQVELFVGGSRGLVVYSGAVECGSTRDFIVAAAKKAYLDGGANTYLHESSADTIGIVAGGTTTLALTATAATVTGTLTATGAVGLAATQRLYLDGVALSGNTYLSESSADTITFVVGGTSTMTLTAAVAVVPTYQFTTALEMNGIGTPFSVRSSTNSMRLGAVGDRATTVGTNAIHILNGTAPAGTLTDACSIYSSGGKLFAMDAAGTATQLTP